ncbi:MAG TPA: response regulator transcription factor [Streptosporangiaceae bacterium]|nr:response regulator transcription factor [Streptosporangiaceae bacterium]
MRSTEGTAAWPGQACPDRSCARILLIDDEPEVSGFIGRALEHIGYQVDVASDPAQGVQRAIAGGYDLVVLDLIMPDIDGRTALTSILAVRPAQAVMMLSCSSDVSTKVQCLNLGARDYLTKPFSIAELLARVQAGLRESARHSEVMRVGGLTLDAGRLVADGGAGPVALTRLEFLCLRALMEHGGDSVTKSELLASVWGIDFDPGSNIVDVCIRRLRAKLGFQLIETVRGEGYRLAP